MDPLAIHALTELRDLLTAALVPKVDEASSAATRASDGHGAESEPSSALPSEGAWGEIAALRAQVTALTAERDRWKVTASAEAEEKGKQCGYCLQPISGATIDFVEVRDLAAKEQARSEGRREGIEAAAHKAGADARANPCCQRTADLVIRDIRSLLSEPEKKECGVCKGLGGYPCGVCGQWSASPPTPEASPEEWHEWGYEDTQGPKGAGPFKCRKCGITVAVLTPLTPACAPEAAPVGEGPLTFRAFSAANRARCEAPDGFNHPLSGWSLSDWFTATLGELGEAANVAKKLNRVRDGIPGNDETPEQLHADLGHEIADTFIYLDLLAQAAGFDLSQIVQVKFNATSIKRGYKRLLGYVPPQGSQDAARPATGAASPPFADADNASDGSLTSEAGGDSLVARLRSEAAQCGGHSWVGRLCTEAADALDGAVSEAARRIAEAVATERETCALEAEFIANSLGLGAAASAMSDDTESLIRRDAGARVAGRVANVIRTRAKKGE